MIRLPDDARLLLCDVWGVVHDGHRASPGALDALARWRGEGRTVVLVTNAPRPGGPIRRQLAALGVGSAHYDALVSSGDTGVALVAAIGEPAGFIGTRIDRAALAAAGVALAATGDEATVICTGLDESRPTAGAYDADLAAMRARDAHMLCFNPDIVAFHGDSLDPCAGAIAQRYAAIGGRVTYTGKPWPPIYARALDLAAAVAGRRFAREEIVAIGDGVPTDLLGAARMGYRFVFVTGGVERAAVAEHGIERFLDRVRGDHGIAGFATQAVVDRLS